jgi:hypothetical protein
MQTNALLAWRRFYDANNGYYIIGVLGAVIDLIKSVIRQVLASRHSHVADRPSSAASTDARPQVPFHRLLESITTKETHGRLQSGARQLGSLAFAHGLLMLRFGRIPNFLISP